MTSFASTDRGIHDISDTFRSVSHSFMPRWRHIACPAFTFFCGFESLLCRSAGISMVGFCAIGANHKLKSWLCGKFRWVAACWRKVTSSIGSLIVSVGLVMVVL